MIFVLIDKNLLLPDENFPQYFKIFSLSNFGYSNAIVCNFIETNTHAASFQNISKPSEQMVCDTIMRNFSIHSKSQYIEKVFGLVSRWFLNTVNRLKHLWWNWNNPLLWFVLKMIWDKNSIIQKPFTPPNVRSCAILIFKIEWKGLLPFSHSSNNLRVNFL